MYFCSAEECTLCFLVNGSAGCLRKQATRCMRLSKTVARHGVRDALEELSLILMDEARSLDKELTLDPAAAH
jgi:hypothetical protein